MEFLKAVLGDELYAQVHEKLKDNKEIKLANLASGEYVGKDKFTALETEKQSLTAQIKERDEQLKELKKVDAAGLQAKIEGLEADKAKAAAEFEAAQKAKDIKHAIDVAILKANGQNPKFIKAGIDIAKIAVDGDAITGLDEQIDLLKKTDPYLFKPIGATGSSGANPPSVSTTETTQVQQEAYAAAMKNGQLAEAIAIKRAMTSSSK